MDRLRNPILFVVVLLLPFLLFYTGWRYWWPCQILLQFIICLIGLFFSFWRFPALVALVLLAVFNFPWFNLNTDIPDTCEQQIDHFSGIVDNDPDEEFSRLRMIKVECWCRGKFRRWPTAEVENAGDRVGKIGWFRRGDRIQLKHISIRGHGPFAVDIRPESRFSISSITYRHRILARGMHLLYIQKKARYYLGEFPASVYKALVTADRSSLTLDWKKRINELGITHLFAISGMHIGILYLWFALVIRWLLSFPNAKIEQGTGVMLTDLISISTIFVFLQIIGMPISAERSFIMLAWWGLMRHFLGWQPLWFILCGTAAIILLGSPTAIGQKAFQLSFLSVAGIIQILPLLPRSHLRDSRWKRFLKLIFSSLIISLWLFVLTMPLVSQLAEQFSLITPFNNVIHIFYLSFIFLPYALLVALFTLLGIPWGGLPGEIYLYSVLNLLGKFWEYLLNINSSLNHLFLFNHHSWHIGTILIWILIFITPFLVSQRIRNK
jgi:ComEC/Rec2-related protein